MEETVSMRSVLPLGVPVVYGAREGEAGVTKTLDHNRQCQKAIAIATFGGSNAC